MVGRTDRALQGLSFRIKLVLLALATVNGLSFRTGKLWVCLSLRLWVALVIAGRGIALLSGWPGLSSLSSLICCRSFV